MVDTSFLILLNRVFQVIYDNGNAWEGSPLSKTDYHVLTSGDDSASYLDPGDDLEDKGFFNWLEFIQNEQYGSEADIAYGKAGADASGFIKTFSIYKFIDEACRGHTRFEERTHLPLSVLYMQLSYVVNDFLVSGMELGRVPRLILEAFELGYTPVGWLGEPPEGKLVVALHGHD